MASDSAGSGHEPSELQGYIDVFKGDRTFEGWARLNASDKPHVVAIRVDDRTVARGVAEHFRRDLLEAGIGHGHYAYRAKLTADLPPGEYQATLWDEAAGIRIATQDAFAFRVAGDRPRRTMTCEDMLRGNESWDEGILLANLRCLNLDYNLRVMGYDRFIDVCHLYALDRRADDAARVRYKNDLATGKTSETEMFSALMRSDERKQRPTPLCSPYDARFPFILTPRETDIVHTSVAAAPPRPKAKRKRGVHKKLFRAVRSLFR